ncbi:MAG: TIGR00366 family protein [Synergistaceae bacterium]|nr:TIGR00366 family protein [Synergistaceae bacterium]
MGKKVDRMPNAVVLLALLIVVVGIMAAFLPTGRYEKIIVEGRDVVDPTSFHIVEKTRLSFLDYFDCIHQGLNAAGPLIFMILVIGGAIRLFESTGAIAGVVAAFARRFGREKSSWVLILVFTFFALLGAFPGMLEAAIPFAPLCVSIALALGYDVFVGIAVPVVGIVIGWSAGPTNPWTVGIGQNMAQLPLFSGIGYRLAALVALWAVSLAYILHYAAKIQKDPSKSLARNLEGVFNEKPEGGLENIPFTSIHKFVLLVFVVTLVTIVFGTIVWKWGFPQMSSLYILGGIVAGIACRYSPNRIADTFIEGGRDIFGGVVAVGLARSISVLMEKAGVIDTIIYYLSLPLANFSAEASASVMFVIQTLINFFIPSGSGQAMATLPVMLPLSDILNVSKQVAILAFQFGDGLSNLCYPTVAVVIAYLTYTKVPFSRWLRFIMPYMVLVWVVAAAFTAGGVVIGWQ